jgi:hypothetical protein
VINGGVELGVMSQENGVWVGEADAGLDVGAGKPKASSSDGGGGATQKWGYLMAAAVMTVLVGRCRLKPVDPHVESAGLGA